MKHPLLLTTLTAAVVTVTAFGAFAAGKGGFRGGERPAFADLDANGDGSLTEAEIQAHMQTQFDTRFAAIDADGNGSISAEELTAHAEASDDTRRADRIAKMIEKRDENGDGVLSAEEMQPKARRGSILERADANKDGVISEEEFADIAKRGGKDGKRKGKPGKPTSDEG